MKTTNIHIKNWRFLCISFFATSLILFSCTKKDYSTAKTPIYTLPETEPVAFDLDQIRERGRITAILNNSSTGYFIYRGQPMGYEYELLTRMADALGLKLDIVLASNVNEAITLLNEGKGDMIASNMAVTTSKQDYVAFTEHHNEVRQVLVQRKPANWRSMKHHEIENVLIRKPLDLEGKEIHVQQNTAFASRLSNLQEEIGGKIKIKEHNEGLDTEAMIRQVADGTIDYTVADEDVALVNATYYPILDVKTAISFPQKIAWATRKNSPQLLESVNKWIHSMKKQTDYYVLYSKYFKSPKATLKRIHSDYSSLASNNVSPYDDMIKQVADSMGWDWRLLASQIYQESQFDTRAESWAGAVGLMQLLPETGALYGISNMTDPQQSIRAGTAYLNWLDRMWTKYISDSEERMKFVLASYNAGQGHVLDARRLAQKYGKNPNKWDNNVEYFLEMKSRPEYYNDPVVSSGYCRGSEPVNYVEQILRRYNSYKQLLDTPEPAVALEASL